MGIWGDSYPMSRLKHNLEKVEQLGFGEEPKRKFLLGTGSSWRMDRQGILNFATKLLSSTSKREY